MVHNDGYKRLIGAIILRAMKDAQAGDDAARRWLHGRDCAHLMGLLGLRHCEIERIDIDAVSFNITHYEAA